MTHKEYNGWHNFETWVVKLWMDNEEGSYLWWREQAESLAGDHAEENADENTWSDATVKLAQQLKESHEESLPELEGFAADLMSAALSEVDWEEIAESLLNDAKEALES